MAEISSDETRCPEELQNLKLKIEFDKAKRSAKGKHQKETNCAWARKLTRDDIQTSVEEEIKETDDDFFVAPRAIIYCSKRN